MRAVAALGILALAALSGCNAPVQRTAAAVAPAPCHCIAAPAEHVAAPAGPRIHRRYRRHYYSRLYARDYSHSYARAHSSHSYREYESADMAQYEYSSLSSVNSYSGGYRSARSYEGEERGAEFWTDGYGRQHYSRSAITRVAADDDKRLDPWHAYNSHCRDRD